MKTVCQNGKRNAEDTDLNKINADIFIEKKYNPRSSALICVIRVPFTVLTQPHPKGDGGTLLAK